MSEKENKHGADFDPIAEGRKMTDEILESYRSDERSSEELLELVHQQNREELDARGVTKHLEESLTDEFWFDPEAKVYVAQQNGYENRHIKLIQIVLEQTFDGETVKTTKTIGQELDGVTLPDEPFSGTDLEVALRQLDGLKQMRDNGMITIDDSLAQVKKTSNIIEQGF